MLAFALGGIILAIEHHFYLSSLYGKFCGSSTTAAVGNKIWDGFLIPCSCTFQNGERCSKNLQAKLSSKNLEVKSLVREKEAAQTELFTVRSTSTSTLTYCLVELGTEELAERAAWSEIASQLLVHGNEPLGVTEMQEPGYKISVRSPSMAIKQSVMNC